MEQTKDFQKITANVPALLLKEAQEYTGEGVTQTITAGLQKLAAGKAYLKLRGLRGSCQKIELDIQASRTDREIG